MQTPRSYSRATESEVPCGRGNTITQKTFWDHFIEYSTVLPVLGLYIIDVQKIVIVAAAFKSFCPLRFEDY